MAERNLATRVIVLDTSAVLAYLNALDPHHKQASNVIDNVTGPLVVPTPILSEIAYMIESRHGAVALVPFLEDVDVGAYLRDDCDSDLKRTIELLVRYADMSLGYADATVMACAERRTAPVLTFDMRHFPIVAREGSFRIVALD